MIGQTELSLRAGINRILDDGDGTNKRITRRILTVYGHDDIEGVSACLNKWKERGLLKILKPYESSQDHEEVVEMLDYIEKESPWPNWPPKQP
jgi:23S rRNA A2030 N6-methylase RlmJ